MRAHVSTQELTVTSHRRTDDKGKGQQQAPDVPDSSRTVHAALSNSRSTYTGTVHTVSTKTTHSWTWLGRSLTLLKQSSEHHQSSPNNYTRQHVYLRTPPRRGHRMLFAELGTINSDLTAVSPFSAACNIICARSASRGP